MKTFIEQVISELRAATHGSRELDMKVHIALGGDAKHFPTMGYRARPGFGHHWEGLPHWTTNIVVALRAVPVTWEWQISNRAPKPDRARAYIHNGELINAGGNIAAGRNPAYRGFEKTAATPALAICIVVLQHEASK